MQVAETGTVRAEITTQVAATTVAKVDQQKINNIRTEFTGPL
jgi:hypothetical protein